MEGKNEFPTTENRIFHQYFDKKKDAIDFLSKQKGTIEKHFKRYIFKYEGVLNLVTTTGRPMYVITYVNGKLQVDFKILTMVQSKEQPSRYKINGYDCIFKSMTNWNCDVYVDYDFQNDAEVKKTILELTKKGQREYIAHVAQTRASRAFIDSLTQSEWDKAKEAGVI